MAEKGESPVRRFVRHQMELPIIFSWSDGHGVRRQAAGRARDVSAGGVFLRSSSCPPVGTPVRVSAFLPSLGSFRPTLWFEARGRVVRVESAEGPDPWCGFATANEKLALRVPATGFHARIA